MTTYGITGASGYIGQLLAQKLARDPGNRVIGIDLRKPKNDGLFTFHRCDIRDPDVGRILKDEAVDVLVHLAFYTLPEGDAREAESINIGGTRNVLRAAAEARVKRLVLASSAAAYGSHPDNPLPLLETHPLRPNDDFYYSWHKAEQENLTEAFGREHPRTKVVILRPCVLIGPHIDNPTGDSLKQKVLVYMKGEAAPIQLIYEDDAAQAFFLAATGDGEGIFNVAAEGTLTYPEFARMMNKKIILLPYRLLAILASAGKRLGLSPVSATTLKFIKNPMVVDATRFGRQFGFKPECDSRQAFLKFIGAL